MRLKPVYLFTALACLSVLVVSCRPIASPVPVPPQQDVRAVTPPAPHRHEQLKGEDRLAATRGPRADSVRSEPQLRIRIAQGLTTATIDNAGSVTVGPGHADLGKARIYTFQTPLRIAHDKQGFVIIEPDGKSVRWRLSTLIVTSPANRVSLDQHPFPGRLELVALHGIDSQPTGRFDAVNHVGMEAYLPGVISKELYPGWGPETYRAQAIAARSYAIWEMNLPMRRESHFDLEASQASQAYIGDKASDKARAAVADTTGQVLTFEHRVLPAFYSSCSGGTGQDAHAAWPGRVDDLAPLRGKTHGGWGQKSTKFRWGPIQRDRLALSRRLAAWGKANEHAIAGIGLLRAIDTGATNRVGRPTRVRVTDENGRRFELSAEEMRLASNYRVAKLPTIDMKNLVFSSHADYTVSGSGVTIAGRGFGHGVGMCQFGAEHMAAQGHPHRAILAFYYAGAAVKKIY